ncbi:MAG: type II toxin-antitoxin system HicA family toxin [Leptospirales bacterium]
MKRGGFIRKLENEGCVFVQHPGKHDVYRNPATRKQTTIPRHSEIADRLCRMITRQLELSENILSENGSALFHGRGPARGFFRNDHTHRKALLAGVLLIIRFFRSM